MKARWGVLLAATMMGVGPCGSAPSRAETVRALSPAECGAVRAALEGALPINAGFQVREENFEDRALALAGR